jgi:hypothetical protein
MKKLNEMTKDELKNLYEANRDFQNAINERCYDTLSFWQNDTLATIFVEKGRERGFRYYDNYNSFYYRLTDAEEFVKGLNDGIGDYFSESDRPVYEKMLKLADEYWNLESDDLYGDKGDKIYDELEETAKKVLQAIEDMLHAEEDITDDLIESEIESALDYMGEYELDDDGIIHTHEEIVWK